MLTGTKAPAQVQVAFTAIGDLPLVPLKPAPAARRLPAKLTALNMCKAANMEKNSFWIGKGVFMRTACADTLGVAGNLLSATSAHERIFVKTITGA